MSSAHRTCPSGADFEWRRGDRLIDSHHLHLSIFYVPFPCSAAALCILVSGKKRYLHIPDTVNIREEPRRNFFEKAVKLQHRIFAKNCQIRRKYILKMADDNHVAAAIPSGNALTMSGALGASREKSQNNNPRSGDRREHRAFDRLTKGKAEGANNNNNNRSGRGPIRDEPRDNRRGKGRDNERRGDDRRGPGRSHRGEERGNRDGNRDRGRGGGGRDGGRDDGQRNRGGGRGRDNNRGRSGYADNDFQRGRGDGYRHRDERNGGPRDGRRSRDDFENEQGFESSGRGGRGRGEGRRDGPGRIGGRFESNKRVRRDEFPGGSEHHHRSSARHGDSQDPDAEQEQSSYQHGPNPFRGGSLSRGGRAPGGRSFFRGATPARSYTWVRGASDTAPGSETTDDTATAAAHHPSPLVQATFSGGRGEFSRGGGTFSYSRGGGRNGGGRTNVQQILASKTWVRKKKEDEGEQGTTDNLAAADSGYVENEAAAKEEEYYEENGDAAEEADDVNVYMDDDDYPQE